MFELFKLQPRDEMADDKGPNRWDWALLPLILALFSIFAFIIISLYSASN